MQNLTQGEAIQKAREVWGNRYDLSVFVYKTSRDKVRIICPIHGDFELTANNFFSGHGCPKCGRLTDAVKHLNKDKALTNEEFIRRAREIHGDKFDYSKVEYKNNYTKVCIICHEKDANGVEHGDFWQTPANHLCGNGCKKCRNDEYCRRRTASYDEYIAKARKVHGDRYNYPPEEYIIGKDKIAIECSIHGIFHQRRSAHLEGEGCPRCNESKGEKKVAEWLDNHNVSYERQHKIKLPISLFSSNRLWVDFYLPDYNTFIEYNGPQHYRRYEFWHKTEDEFRDQQVRDQRLREYCKLQKIKLIEIPYTKMDKIDNILKREIK